MSNERLIKARVVMEPTTPNTIRARVAMAAAKPQTAEVPLLHVPQPDGPQELTVRSFATKPESVADKFRRLWAGANAEDRGHIIRIISESGCYVPPAGKPGRKKGKRG